MTRDEVIAYAQDRYGAEPEYLWEKAPTGFVLRHQSNRKWFAVSMDVRPESRTLRLVRFDRLDGQVTELNCVAFGMEGV